jgi:hypothetical protein
MLTVSSTRSEYDQELDSLLVGPIPVGVNKFIFEADPPDLKRIPSSDILGVTVILLTCSYDGREFVRVGYYVNNEYDSEELNAEPPAKPIVERVRRNVLAEKPRVTRFAIKWYGLPYSLIMQMCTVSSQLISTLLGIRRSLHQRNFHLSSRKLISSPMAKTMVQKMLWRRKKQMLLRWRLRRMVRILRWLVLRMSDRRTVSQRKMMRLLTLVVRTLRVRAVVVRKKTLKKRKRKREMVTRIWKWVMTAQRSLLKDQKDKQSSMHKLSLLTKA